MPLLSLIYTRHCFRKTGRTGSSSLKVLKRFTVEKEFQKLGGKFYFLKLHAYYMKPGLT